MGKRGAVILILGIILSFRGAIGQTLPDACPGSKVRYSVQGLPNSLFSWNVTGGTIVTSYNDSVDVQWNSSQGTYQISVTEVTEFNCTGPVTISDVRIGGDTANLGGNQAICVGNFANFKLNKPFAKYLWYDNSTDSLLNSGIPGIKWVEVTNSAGCVSRDSVNLTVNSPVAVNLGPDLPICDTNKILNGPLPDSVATYFWTIIPELGSTTNESGPSIEIQKTDGPQTVVLAIVDIHGCANTDTVKMLDCSTKLGISNTITADGNGVNDNWYINNIWLYPKAVISLYDRWGRLVYSKAGNYQNDFDGTLPGGRKLPMDSYFYVIDLRDGSKPITGYLLIIR